MGTCVSKPNPSNSASLRPWCSQPQPRRQFDVTSHETRPPKICICTTDPVSGLSKSQSSVDSDVITELVNEPTAEELLCAELRQESVKFTSKTSDTSASSEKGNLVEESLTSTAVEIAGEEEADDGLTCDSEFVNGPSSDRGDFGTAAAMASNVESAEPPVTLSAIQLLSNHLVSKGSALRVGKSASKRLMPQGTRRAGLVSPIAKTAPRGRLTGVTSASDVNTSHSTCAEPTSEADNKPDLSGHALVRTYSTDRHITGRGACRPPTDFVLHTGVAEVHVRAAEVRARFAAADLEEGFSQMYLKENDLVAREREDSTRYAKCVPVGKVERCVRIFDDMTRSSETGTLEAGGYPA